MLKKQGTVYLIVLNSQPIKFSFKCFEKDIIIVSKKDPGDYVEKMQKQKFNQQRFCKINREIKIHVYRKRQTSDSSWEFLRIENKQIKTVPNDSFG